MADKPKSGMYKTKARNLTDKQLQRAGGLSASKKRTVSVSDTTRATSGANKGRTLGPGGKPLTGTVVMANGDRAVYRAGKRVTNVPKKSISTGGSGTGTPKANSGNGGRTVRGGDALSRSMKAGSTPRFNRTIPSSGVTPRGGKTDARTQGSKPNTPAAKPQQTKASSAPSYGGKAGGTGPVGSSTQQKIVQLKNRISATKAAYARNQARASRDAKAAAQARQDIAVIRQLEAQLKKLQ